MVLLLMVVVLVLMMVLLLLEMVLGWWSIDWLRTEVSFGWPVLQVHFRGTVLLDRHTILSGWGWWRDIWGRWWIVGHWTVGDSINWSRQLKG